MAAAAVEFILSMEARTLLAVAVIESIMKINFLIRSVDSFSWPLGIIFALKPGIMPTTLLKEPMFSTLLNWSRMSLNVNLPDLI